MYILTGNTHSLYIVSFYFKFNFPIFIHFRTPNYNLTSPDKHWVVRVSPPLDDIRARFTDLLHRRRLLTLLSLDDAIERLVKSLRRINELDNTYIFFSSDHGYHLGQFNLVKGKAQPDETDIKIPMYVRGPRITPNRK